MFGDPVTNPKGWPTVTVGEELDFLTSGSRGWAKYYADDGNLFIRIQNLKKGRIDLSDTAFVQAPESAESRRTKVESGNVLLSVTADLGRTGVVTSQIKKAHINQHLVILRFRDMNSTYASQFFESIAGQRQFDRLNRQGVKAGLNFDDVRGLTMLKPPSILQQKFAGTVQHIYMMTTLRQQNATEMDGLFASLQSQAFSGAL